MDSKKHILIRSKFMIPMSREMGLSKRIHDGYVLTEDEKITEAGEYTEEKGDQMLVLKSRAILRLMTLSVMRLVFCRVLLRRTVMTTNHL